MLDHLEIEKVHHKILISRNKISFLLGMCRFPVPLCSVVEVSKVGEISLVAKLRSHTPPEPRSISQNQEGRDWGSCVAANFPSVFVQPWQRENGRHALIFTRAYPGLWLATWEKEVTKSPPSSSHSEGRWRKRQAAPTLTERKASESGENKIEG